MQQLIILGSSLRQHIQSQKVQILVIQYLFPHNTLILLLLTGEECGGTVLSGQGGRRLLAAPAGVSSIDAGLVAVLVTHEPLLQLIVHGA